MPIIKANTMTTQLLIFLSFCAICSAQLGPPRFQLTDQGVEVTIPVNGYSRAAIHYSINKELAGTTASEYAKDFDINNLRPGEQEWKWVNNIPAHEGDVIHYWIWGEKNGIGETITDKITVLRPITSPLPSVSTTKLSTTISTTISSTVVPLVSTTGLATDTPSTTTDATTLSQESTPLRSSRTLSSGLETGSSSSGLGNYTTIGSFGSFNITSNTSVGINGTPNGTMTGTSYSTDGNGSLNNNSAGGNGSNTSNSYYSTSSTRGSGGTPTGSLSGNGTSNYYYSNTGGSGSQTTVGSREGSCCGQEYNCQTYPCLVFQDEFDSLNLCVWEHEITAGGNGDSEFQYYTNNRSNSYVRDGKLFIKPTLTSDHYGEDFLTSGTLDLWGGFNDDTCTSNAFSGCKRVGSVAHPINPVQSARLRSKRGFSFKYGKVEVEAKLPKGDWLWPAIKMLPTWNVYGRWPASGEIDIVEARGNTNYMDSKGVSKGTDSVTSSLHFGPSAQHDHYERLKAERILTSETFADGYHKFAVAWDEKKISFLVDDQEIKTITPPDGGFWELGKFNTSASLLSNPWQGGTGMAPFDQQFYIVLDVAVGGTTFFPDTWLNFPYPKPWRDASDFVVRDFWQARRLWYPTWNPNVNNGEDAALKINYIKVWKLKQ